jgi:hypothetical protein
MGNANHNTVRLISDKPSDDQNQHSSMETEQEPFFQEYSWTGDHRKAGEDNTAHDLRDVLDGLSVVSAMLEMDDLNRDTCQRPLFSRTHAGKLKRMQTVVQRMMAALVDVDIDAENEKLRCAGVAA